MHQRKVSELEYCRGSPAAALSLTSIPVLLLQLLLLLLQYGNVCMRLGADTVPCRLVEGTCT